MHGLSQLTADQRRQIYEEEKHRIEQSSPALSKKAKLLIAVYSLGCLLIYFGISDAALDFWGTRKWELRPEPHFFESLVEAAVMLVRPFLAVVLTFWVVAIPAGIIWGAWLFGADFIKFLKRLINRHND